MKRFAQDKTKKIQKKNGMRTQIDIKYKVFKVLKKKKHKSELLLCKCQYTII